MNCIVIIGDRNKSAFTIVSKYVADLKNKYTIYWAYDKSKWLSGFSAAEWDKLTQSIKEIPFSNSEIEFTRHPGFFNYSNILYNNIKELEQYEYIYCTHTDVNFSGSFYDLYNRTDNIKADFLSTKIKEYDYARTDKWMWINDYLDNTKKEDKEIKKFIGSFDYWFRLSVDALHYLTNYKESDIKEAFYELSVPTILYNYGFDMRSIDVLSDPEFQSGICFIKESTFRACNSTDKSTLTKYGSNLLYNGFKFVDKIIIIDIASNTKFDTNHTYECAVIVPVLSNDFRKEIFDAIDSQSTNLDYCIAIVDETDSMEFSSFCFNAKHPCIYISKKDNGLADTLNIGLNNTKAEMYFIKSPNSKISNSTLSEAFYAGCQAIHDAIIFSTENVKYGDCKLTLDNITSEHLIWDGMLLKNSVKTLPFLFEEYYKDYVAKFAYTCIKYNLSVATSSVVLPFNAICYKTAEEEQEKIERLINFQTGGNISCILTFRNEGIEVEKTVQSIRATAKNAEIILVNDASEDDIDYKSIATYYKCQYVAHNKAIGCGPSRDDGVNHCNTQYFILLDSHMRFYELNWDERLIKHLDENPNAMICCSTTIINKDSNGYYTNEDCHNPKPSSICASFNDTLDHFCDVTWCSKRVDKSESDELFTVMCVLGACYACSVKNWNYIYGLNGLSIYGLDEGLLSLKMFLCGMKCLMLRNLYVGHIYRDRTPYSSSNTIVEGNRLMCIDLLLSEEERPKYIEAMKKKLGYTGFQNALKLYDASRQKETAELRKKLLPRFVRTFDEWLTINNTVK